MKTPCLYRGFESAVVVSGAWGGGGNFGEAEKVRGVRVMAIYGGFFGGEKFARNSKNSQMGGVKRLNSVGRKNHIFS
ncbi:hypothetical protein [Dolichospermum circinale]|uniref:hypothetical protein n=1 Tax=Dolichospermum circinale TaxID=109265 RepID=UPI0004822546|nr:hypothetical protein [Dolichospermum circinale]